MPIQSTVSGRSISAEPVDLLSDGDPVVLLFFSTSNQDLLRIRNWPADRQQRNSPFQLNLCSDAWGVEILCE